MKTDNAQQGHIVIISLDHMSESRASLRALTHWSGLPTAPSDPHSKRTGRTRTFKLQEHSRVYSSTRIFHAQVLQNRTRTERIIMWRVMNLTGGAIQDFGDIGGSPSWQRTDLNVIPTEDTWRIHWCDRAHGECDSRCVNPRADVRVLVDTLDTFVGVLKNLRIYFNF